MLAAGLLDHDETRDSDTTMPNLDTSEIEYLLSLQSVCLKLQGWHEHQAAVCDAMGYDNAITRYHDERGKLYAIRASELPDDSVV